MGFITDILKEVPLSSVLREKLVTADAQIDALKSENTNLRELVKQKDGEIERLKKDVERLKQPIPSPSFGQKRPPFRCDG